MTAHLSDADLSALNDARARLAEIRGEIGDWQARRESPAVDAAVASFAHYLLLILDRTESPSPARPSSGSGSSLSWEADGEDRSFAERFFPSSTPPQSPPPAAPTEPLGWVVVVARTEGGTFLYGNGLHDDTAARETAANARRAHPTWTVEIAAVVAPPATGSGT